MTNDQSKDDSYGNQAMRGQYIVCMPEKIKSEEQKHKKRNMQFSKAPYHQQNE